MDANRLGDLTVGVATSAYQIEGAIDRDGKGPSIWDTFAARPGTIKNGDTGEHAAAHYDKVADDVDLLAWLGVDLYSFSIAWPRIQPDGTGPPNPAGVGFYDRLVDLLLERNITPAVTLYHWDLPEALQGKGGWPIRDTAERFAEYALLISGVLGDRVPLWTTLNEPWVSAFLGYHMGIHAPGIRDDQAAVDAAHHLLLGHGLATQALRTTTTGKVGLVINPTVVWPASDRPEDVDAAWLVDGVRNRVWLDPVLGGAYPSDVLHAFETVADISSIRPGDLATISTPIDWLGINYYAPESASAAGPGDAPRVRASASEPAGGDPRVRASASEPAGGDPIGPGLDHVYMARIEGDRTTMDWPIRPDGLTELLVRIHRDYGLASSSEAVGHRQVELWVTENGAAYFDTPDADGQVHDEPRVRYLDQHLAAALDARDQGVPLAGYIVWSFLDNFEWAEGYEQRFGVIYVDYETQRRIPKDSAHWLRDLLRERNRQR